MRVRGSAAVALGVVLLSACAQTTPRPPAAPLIVASAPPDVVVTVPPTTGPPEPGVDVAPAQIRSAPAACGVPVHHLSSYKGRVGETETTLQMQDGYAMGMAPVEPVEVDATGDGSLDLVGVLSCTVSGEARPDWIVLYTGPATPVASYDLARAERHRYAVVRSLREEGGEVIVEWTAFDSPGDAGVQLQGVVVWNGTSLGVQRVRRSSGPRTITVEDAAFVTADGNVRCVLHGATAWCDVADTTWTPPPAPTAPPSPSPTSSAAPPTSTTATPSTGSSPTPSPAEASAPVDCGDRPYGRTFLIESGRARQTCAGEQGSEVAFLGGGLTSWHRQGWDATVTVDGRRSAGMTPGSTMTTSAVTCRAASSLVTCTDVRTQASFTVGRTTARVSSG